MDSWNLKTILALVFVCLAIMAVPNDDDEQAMCETDTECEAVRVALCEAARDDGADSDYCNEED